MEFNSSQDAHAPRNNLARALSSPGRFLLVMGVYFAVQFLGRLIASPTTDLDESEQLLATQQLAWGYGPQPPLYTWLQFPLIKLFGPCVFPLALLKAILLFILYALTYFNARLVTRNHWLATLAACSLLFLPQIAWESQRDLTHSVLVTIFAAATFHVFLRLAQTPSPSWFIALGTCIGLGTLSKYSYGVFLAGIVCAALSDREWRKTVCHRGVIVSLCVAGVIVAPHLIWVTQHTRDATATARKFQMLGDASWVAATGLGLKNLIVAVTSYTAALLAIYALCCWRKSPDVATSPPTTGRDANRLMFRAMVFILSLLAVGVLLFKATGFKDRWFSPVFIWLPVLLVSALRARLDGARVGGMILLTVVIGLGIAVAIPGRIHFATTLGQPQRHNTDFETMSQAIAKEAMPKLIFTENNWLGGNPKRCFPDAFVFSPQIVLATQAVTGADCLVVWDVTKTNALDPEFAMALDRTVSTDLNATNLHYSEAALLHFPSRKSRIGFAFGRLK